MVLNNNKAFYITSYVSLFYASGHAFLFKLLLYFLAEHAVGTYQNHIDRVILLSTHHVLIPRFHKKIYSKLEIKLDIFLRTFLFSKLT